MLENLFSKLRAMFGFKKRRYAHLRLPPPIPTVDFSEFLKVSLQGITLGEYEVLVGLFLYGKSINEISQTWKWPKRETYSMKVSALKKLKVFLISQDGKRKFEFRLKEHWDFSGQDSASKKA